MSVPRPNNPPPRIYHGVGEGRDSETTADKEGGATLEQTARPDEVRTRRETVLVDGLAFVFDVRLEFEGQTANKHASMVAWPGFYTEHQFQQAVTEALNRAYNIGAPAAHGDNEQNSNTEEPPGTPPFGGTDLF